MLVALTRRSFIGRRKIIDALSRGDQFEQEDLDYKGAETIEKLVNKLALEIEDAVYKELLQHAVVVKWRLEEDRHDSTFRRGASVVKAPHSGQRGKAMMLPPSCLAVVPLLGPQDLPRHRLQLSSRSRRYLSDTNMPRQKEDYPR